VGRVRAYLQADVFFVLQYFRRFAGADVNAAVSIRPVLKIKMKLQICLVCVTTTAWYKQQEALLPKRDRATRCVR